MDKDLGKSIIFPDERRNMEGKFLSPLLCHFSHLLQSVALENGNNNDTFMKANSSVADIPT